MSISEKLNTIAENEQKVFEAGQSNGKKAFMNEYVDNCAKYGVNDYNYAFAGRGWTNSTFKPAKNLVIRKGNYIFAYNGLQGSLIDILNNLGITMEIDSTMPTYGNQNMFYESKFTEIPRLIFPTSCGSLPYVFYNCTSLKKIEALGVHEAMTYSNTFTNCSKLSYIRIEGAIAQSISFSSSPLTTESIVNIIEHLSDTSSGKSLTLKTSAVNNMVFPHTSSQSGVTYNSWDELIATKQNWTFSKA